LVPVRSAVIPSHVISDKDYKIGWLAFLILCGLNRWQTKASEKEEGVGDSVHGLAGSVEVKNLAV
jgi:hypothetical protein